MKGALNAERSRGIWRPDQGTQHFRSVGVAQQKLSSAPHALIGPDRDDADRFTTV